MHDDPSNDPRESAVMTLGDHLDELRRRVLWAAAVPLPIALIALSWSEPIRNFLCEPALRALRMHNLPAQLQVLSPIETIGTDFKIAFVAAVTFGAPWILLQLWKFVEPGLYAHERRFVRLLAPLSAALTLSAMLLLYYVFMPMMLDVLVGFGSDEPQRMTLSTGPATDGATTIPVLAETPAHPVAGQVWLTPDHRLAVAVPMEGDSMQVLSVPLVAGSRLAQQFRLSEYLDFTLDFAMAMALAFQTPVVVLLLGWIGVVTPQGLGRFRRYAIFLAAVAGALVTPTGDPISATALGVPVYGLFELGVLLLRIAPPSAVAQGRVLARLRRLGRAEP
jgi:Sec-independent protein secretion pathway component TatC